jgi:hypothetical protein
VTRVHLLSLKGSVASFWLCADDFRSFPDKKTNSEPVGLRICVIKRHMHQQLAAHSITSSARASSGADRETKRPCRLQIGCQHVAPTARRILVIGEIDFCNTICHKRTNVASPEFPL